MTPIPTGTPPHPPAARHGGTLRLPAELLAAVHAHARAAYPEECCGALLGPPPRDADAPRAVARVVPVPNAAADGRGGRFLIPAAAVRALEGEAARGGLAVLGFYHSHPDGRPHPSRTDREAAWPWYSYLIVAVAADGAVQARAWRLADDRTAFLPQDLRPGEEERG
ncbi:M67 family metallopeptidase [Longimicrobium sp.]|uniref:M67 family metallopeptidase n=1 Tax=Longimicrobium sp. TaxID=2029185 RepID=UPI002E305D1B|nr:M67 family metallopeptidase [Longimicrobium sp.]HEX6038510.1 M67 family metallopeptidase [Longimicrobium sp.]